MSTWKRSLYSDFNKIIKIVESIKDRKRRLKFDYAEYIEIKIKIRELWKMLLCQLPVQNHHVSLQLNKDDASQPFALKPVGPEWSVRPESNDKMNEDSQKKHIFSINLGKEIA